MKHRSSTVTTCESLSILSGEGDVRLAAQIQGEGNLESDAAREFELAVLRAWRSGKDALDTVHASAELISSGSPGEDRDVGEGVNSTRRRAGQVARDEESLSSILGIGVECAVGPDGSSTVLGVDLVVLVAIHVGGKSHRGDVARAPLDGESRSLLADDDRLVGGKLSGLDHVLAESRLLVCEQVSARRQRGEEEQNSQVPMALRRVLFVV